MRNISKEELNKILKEHKLWLEGKGGKCADLRYVDLSYANLNNANLRRANLRYADLSNTSLRYVDLSYANLRRTNLSGADLRCANLRHADLSNADLRCANLTCADLEHAYLEDADLIYTDLIDSNLKYVNLIYTDLRYANLEGADLRYANLKDANLVRADLRRTKLKDVKTNIYTLGYTLACPETGSFIGYKKANGCIVKLLIPDDAKRSSATTTKCRTNKAKVLDIENIKTGEKIKEISSNYDNNFVYKVGEIVRVDNFDDDRWNECATGIHFFMNRENAIKYR